MIIKNGLVLDPVTHFYQKADVAVSGGRIAAIAADLPRGKGGRVIEAAGCFVVPGLIDMHCHLYPRLPFTADAIPGIFPDAHLFQQGVTTAVDAGSCGWRDFPAFLEQVVNRSKVRVLAFLNIALDGMMDMQSEQNPAAFHPQICAAVAKAYPEIIVGMKSAHYWVGRPFDAGHTPWASVDRTLEAAALCGLPAMIDMQPALPFRSYPELLQKLRPGDIHTHVFAQQFPVLDQNGRCYPYLFAARERGVRFDLGHGAGSFWFRNAVPCHRQGFDPDTLSTDLYLDNVNGPSMGLLHILSKYLAIGMPLPETIRRVTEIPALLLGRPDLGKLQVGGGADLAVLHLQEGFTGFVDSGQARLTGRQTLSCRLTVRGGEVVFNPTGLGMPDWEEAPPSYWTAPGIIKEETLI